MAERWIFTKEQLQNTPSRKCGIDYAKELSYRQQSANLVQEMGQRLQVNQLCINTAIVYMHRFYMFQSFGKFHRSSIAPACLFLAAKVEEQLRKLEHVIKVARSCMNRELPSLDTKSDEYLNLAQELVVNENILLQSLGFDIQVDHPHTHVVKTCQLVRASKDLAQTSYFLATNSLHLTTLCLQYKPTVVACVCIHIASNWSEYEIAVSHEGKQWFKYVDNSVTPELLTGLTQEFLTILENCPLKLKRKILTWKSGHRGEDESMSLEKRHKGETSGASSSSRPHEKARADTKTRKSEPAIPPPPPFHMESKPPQDLSQRPTKTPPVSLPNSSGGRKPVCEPPGARSVQVKAENPLDAQKKPADGQTKPIAFRDYKSYREHKEKLQTSGGGPVPQISAIPPEAQQVSVARKHKPGEDTRNKRESKPVGHMLDASPSVRSGDESLKLHIKKERIEDDALKMLIKKERIDESLKIHIKKESGTHKIRHSASPIKLKIKAIPPCDSPVKYERPTTTDSLKMKLPMKTAAQLSERPAKQRRSESYTSSFPGSNSDPKHAYPVPLRGVGGVPVDGNGVHLHPRHSNSQHISQQVMPGFVPIEHSSTGSIFSPPPIPQGFDMFNTSAMMSQGVPAHMVAVNTSGMVSVNTSGMVSVNTAGGGVFPGYQAIPNPSSTFNDTFSTFMPDMFGLGDAGPPTMLGLETTNGGSMKVQQAVTMPTKEKLEQIQADMHKMFGQSKQMAVQQQNSQLMYGVYMSNPPLPSVPPPPPPPPEEPPRPPPPPPTN